MADSNDPSPTQWTVDKDTGDLLHGPIEGCPYDSYIAVSRSRGGTYLTAEGYDALAADIQAARDHERCGPFADTLRQARELARLYYNRGSRRYSNPSGMEDHLAALLDLLVEGGTDG
jgi:hypothetical protein